VFTAVSARSHFSGQTGYMSLESWDGRSADWIAWARAPGHDSYWRFHRDAFLRLLPPSGRLTLEIGCGEGRVLRDLVRAGHQAVGVDLSSVLARAATTHPEAVGEVVVADAVSLPFPDAVADCVVAFMSLQDIEGFEQAVIEAGRVLAPQGYFVLAITHPLNTAGLFGPAPIERDRPFVIHKSWFERRVLIREAERNGYSMTFEMEHRPLQAYADALAEAGFLIERIQEVGEPDDENKWSRIPLFLHLRAVRS
jgi:ubiquinone/menaquinone biosynthesis C-methylase UbiE